MVYAQDYGYNVLTQLTSKLSASISSPQPKVEISALGNLSVYSRVAAASTTPTGYATGEALQVTLDDASNFRVGDIIADNNMVQGIIVDKPSGGGNLIIVKRVSTTFATATHFLAGSMAKVLFDSSAN
ncbi:hypothetical protein EBT25_15935, partial [bacterium]|nr:hypothetical protein [bacterium]